MNREWPKTAFTQRGRVSLPLIQAPMAGGITTPELVAAVSKAGGVGSLGAALMQPEEIRKAIHRIRELTRRPFNVNLFSAPPLHEMANCDPFLHHLKKYEGELGFTVSTELLLLPPFEKQVEALLQEEIPIFSFTFGIPPIGIIREFQKRNTLVIGTATHVKEAFALQEAGVDFIVAQGKEAGGHRGTFLEDALLPTLQLVQECKSQVKKPCIAAGGIMHGKEIAAALKAGAVAVQMGTAFLTCAESGAHPAYKKALLEWKKRKTILTRAFTGKWARAIENRFLREIGQVEIPPYPIARSLMNPLQKAAAKGHNAEFMSLWAGEHFPFCEAGSAQEWIAKISLELPF